MNLLKTFKIDALTRKVIYIAGIAIFVLTNLLMGSTNLRLDLSRGHAYTLAPATQKIIKNLDDAITIKFFVSSSLPSRLAPIKGDIVDLLREYKKTGGKIDLKIVDPKKDEAAERETAEIGIPEIQFSQLERDKYAVSSGYFGLAVYYGNKRDTINQVSDFNSLEYNITSIIYRLTQNKIAKVGIIGAPTEPEGEQQGVSLSLLRKLIESQFVLQDINISSGSARREIEGDIGAIIVLDDNKKSYDEVEKEEIGKYLDKGGKALFFADGVWVLDTLRATSASHNLFEFLKGWGITVNKDLVLSTSAELVNFGNQEVQFMTPYPFWIKTNNFRGDTSYFSNINQILFPWTSSLKIEPKKDFKIKEIIRSPKSSWSQKDQFVLNPQQIPEPQKQDLKEVLLGVSSIKKDRGEIVVVPSSRFVADRYQGRSADNLSFVLNVLNDFASHGALTGIISRSVSFYPLPDLPDAQRDFFKYSNILFLPFLFGIYGAVRLLRRR